MGRFLIYIAVLAGALFSACTQNDVTDGLMQEGQLAQIEASVAFDGQDFSSDSQIIPMRSANIPYYNFAFCNSEFVVLRDLGDRYQVVSFENYTNNDDVVSMKIDKSTVYSLTDFNIQNTKMVLQEGKYLAYLMINGPVRVFFDIPQKGTILPKDWSVIDGPVSYLSGIRAMYFQSVSFEVKRNEGLNGPLEQELSFDRMTRLCSPVRFIHNLKGDAPKELYVYMNIRGKKSAIPTGITATGEFLMSEDESEVLFNTDKTRFVTLYKNAELSQSDDSWSLPSYRNSGKTSLFVPIAEDAKEVNLELEITSIEGSASRYFTGSVKVPVTLRRDSITEVFLEIPSKNILQVSYEDQGAFRNKWENQYPDIRYQYLEYN